eukprot:358644-Chlamydomonas_euryale.AAC.7
MGHGRSTTALGYLKKEPMRSQAHEIGHKFGHKIGHEIGHERPRDDASEEHGMTFDAMPTRGTRGHAYQGHKMPCAVMPGKGITRGALQCSTVHTP